MSLQPVHQIVLRGGPGPHEVEELTVDGASVDVYSLTIEADADNDRPMTATLRIDWAAYAVAIKAAVTADPPMPADMAATLRALGWTPPAEPTR